MKGVGGGEEEEKGSPESGEGVDGSLALPAKGTGCRMQGSGWAGLVPGAGREPVQQCVRGRASSR